MITEKHLDDLLAVADPAGGGPLPRPPATFLAALRDHDAPYGAQHAALREDGPPAAVRRLPRRLLAGAGAGLAAAVTIGLAALPGGTPSAFADYVTTPTPLTPGQREELLWSCAGQLDAMGGPFADLPAAEPVLAEARGSWRYVVLVSATEVTTCLDRPGGDQGPIVAGGGLTPGTTGRPARGAAFDNMVISQAPPGEEPAPDAFGSAVGRAATDVVAVDLLFADGRSVHTTLTTDGWWGAWWPGGLDEDGDGGPTVLRWTTADGQEVEAPLGDG